MTNNAVEILLVEDNPNDVELTLHALEKSHITNHFHVVRDGAETQFNSSLIESWGSKTEQTQAQSGFVGKRN